MGSIQRRRIAREAARLLYYNLCKEYKYAKEKAAKSLGMSALPSNFEVAVELDRLADELEGSARKGLIIEMRKTALGVMTLLESFHPRLIGSVWRGTSRKGSDIDIEVFSNGENPVIKEIEMNYQISRTERMLHPGEGRQGSSVHVYIFLPSGHKAEVLVRKFEDISEKRKCGIYGDRIVGLTLHKLRRVLEEDPYKRFIPSLR